VTETIPTFLFPHPALGIPAMFQQHVPRSNEVDWVIAFYKSVLTTLGCKLDVSDWVESEKTWLVVLLSGYEVEQREEFY
jgi:hypothetical protein